MDTKENHFVQTLVFEKCHSGLLWLKINKLFMLLTLLMYNWKTNNLNSLSYNKIKFLA